MHDNKYLTGITKFLFFQYLKIYVFFKYLKRVIKGEIGFKQFAVFLKRVLLLFDKIKVNKVVKTRGVYKMHIYLPAFPTKAFFTALDKFLIEQKKPEEINPTSVLLSITKTCNYNCEHCYQKKDSVEPITIKELKRVGGEIQDLGISFINIEGGEPLIAFKRLKALLEVLDENSEVWVNTNGVALTHEKAEEMKKLGVFGVMISLHHWKEEKHDQFVGKEGAFDTAISALKIFKEAGIATAINCTGTRELIEEEGFDKIMEIAKDTGCALVQLIHEKPAGGWLGRKGVMKEDYINKLVEYHLSYSVNKEHSEYPAISSQAFESMPDKFGCTAGGIERFYINASGEVQPCEFVNVSFGNVQEENFREIYKRMRKVFDKPRTNWLCCTESQEIKNKFEELDLETTPIPKSESKDLIKNFDLGEETKLYKKMNLYE